jgi:predicted enzyme related to lactoylglutathione lyase
MATVSGAHLRHIGIRTRDIEGTATFYESVFGLTRLQTDPSGRSAVIGDGVINITVVPVVDRAPEPAEEGSEPIHLGFIVSDLHETFRRCRAAGATILTGDVSSRDPLPEGALPETDLLQGRRSERLCDRRDGRPRPLARRPHLTSAQCSVPSAQCSARGPVLTEH